MLSVNQLVKKLSAFMEHKLSLPCLQNMSLGFNLSHLNPVHITTLCSHNVNFILSSQMFIGQSLKLFPVYLASQVIIVEKIVL
jgi:hypothetical protein